MLPARFVSPGPIRHVKVTRCLKGDLTRVCHGLLVTIAAVAVAATVHCDRWVHATGNRRSVRACFLRRQYAVQLQIDQLVMEVPTYGSFHPVDEATGNVVLPGCLPGGLLC